MDNPKKGNLHRVPPHDTETERHLLGAALLHRDAAAILAEVAPDDFTTPAHATIAAVIGGLVAEETPVDLGTVAAVLRARGQLDGISNDGYVGGAYLTHLQAICPSIRSAPVYASWVQLYARQRHMLGLAGSVVDAVYAGMGTDGLVAEMSKASEDDLVGRISSWDAANLALTLAGEGTSPEPTYLHRSDGTPLLYPEKVHAFNAEPETGKSWLALACCAERLAAGEHCLYIDFEAGPADIVERLLALGVAPSDILERFHYVRPDEPVDAGARLRMLGMFKVWPITICIIDGMAEAMSLSGWDENAAEDVTRFFTTLARPIAREGAAVVIIDHLQKDKDKQGSYARGSGAKLAAIDGACFKLEVITPFARGMNGLAKVIVTKDRHGFIRRSAAGGKVVGEMHVHSKNDGDTVTVSITPPARDARDGHFRPTFLMERVSLVLEESTVGVSQRWVEKNVKGTSTHIRSALAALVSEGFVDMVEAGGKTTLHSSVRPFRAPSAEPDMPEDPGYDEDEEF